MTQEDKMLLIKDLSSRLPYSVHVQHTSEFSGTLYNISMHHKYDENDNIYDVICYTDFFGDGDSITIEHFKPYLFPLSSLTEEMMEELNTEGFFKYDNTIANISYLKSKNGISKEIYTYVDIESASILIEFFNSHHIDYRGLIEKGLAIDATGLNIYC